MARRSGMMTALQAALAGFSGGIEGRMQQQAADEEKSRVAAALARQQGLDVEAAKERAMRLRSSLIGSGYTPEGAPSRDMAGATPRTPISTEEVDGVKYNLYETPQDMAHRREVQDEQRAMRAADRAAASRQPTYRAPISTVGQTGVNMIRPETGESTFVPFAKGFTPRQTAASSRQTKTGEPSAKTKESMRMAEAWFNAPNDNPEQVRIAREIFVALREARPDALPQELMLDAYNAIKAQAGMKNTMAQIGQRERSNLAKPAKAGGRAPISGNAPPGKGGANKPETWEDFYAASQGGK